MFTIEPDADGAFYVSSIREKGGIRAAVVEQVYGYPYGDFPANVKRYHAHSADCETERTRENRALGVR